MEVPEEDGLKKVTISCKESNIVYSNELNIALNKYKNFQKNFWSQYRRITTVLSKGGGIIFDISIR